jgi:hypothetical protein
VTVKGMTGKPIATTTTATTTQHNKTTEEDEAKATVGKDAEARPSPGGSS